jgi:hypothetical protein
MDSLVNYHDAAEVELYIRLLIKSAAVAKGCVDEKGSDTAHVPFVKLVGLKQGNNWACSLYMLRNIQELLKRLVEGTLKVTPANIENKFEGACAPKWFTRLGERQRKIYVEVIKRLQERYPFQP